MSPLYVYNGKLLVRDGKLATDQNCCCECNCNNCACTFTITFQDTNVIPNGDPISVYEPPGSGTSACWSFSVGLRCGKTGFDLATIFSYYFYYLETLEDDMIDALAGVPDNLYIMYTIAEAGGVVDYGDPGGNSSYCGGCGNTPKIRIVFYIFDQLSNCCPHNQQPTIFFDTGTIKLFQETSPTTWPSEGIIGQDPTIAVNCES